MDESQSGESDIGKKAGRLLRSTACRGAGGVSKIVRLGVYPTQPDSVSYARDCQHVSGNTIVNAVRV